MQWSSFGVLVKSVWVFKLKSLFNDHSLENIYLTRLFFSHFFLFLPITTASVYIGQMPFWSSVLWGNLKLKQKEGLHKPAWSVLSHQLKQILKHLWSLQQEPIWSTCTEEHLFLIINAAPGSFQVNVTLCDCCLVSVSSARCHDTKSIQHSQELNQEQKLVLLKTFEFSELSLLSGTEAFWAF